MSDTLGPVEVEFSIPDDFGRDIDSSIKKMAGLTGAASKLPADVKAAMVEQSAIVKLIGQDIQTLEKALDTVAPGKAKQEMIQEVAAAKKALAEEKAALQDLTTSYDQSRESSKRLSMQLRDMQDQLTRMRIAGQQNTAEYKLLEGAAAKLADELRDVKSVTKSIGDDQAQFKGFADGVTGLTGAFAAAGGAVALFAGENENLQKIQTKVQGLMAITIGLQQVSTALNKDSAFMTVTVVKAKQLWAAAEKSLTATLWGSNVAAKALMATMTLGVAIAIPALIELYDRLVQKQEAAVAAQKEAKRITTESNIEAGKSKIEIDQVIRKLETFKGSKESEKRVLGEVNKAYGDTFGTYKTLAEWLDVLKAKAADYVQVMFLQSKATRLVDKAIKFETQAQQAAAQPLTDFVDTNDITKNTDILGRVDEEKLKLIAEQRRKSQVDLANARKDLALKEAGIIQAELQSLQNSAGINTNFDEKTKDAEKQTFAQKLAEVKKFFELYKIAIDNGQTEAAELFKKKLPTSETYKDYINEELKKANAQGNTEKLAVLIPEKEAFTKGFNELLTEFQTYNEKRATIEKQYNDKIKQLSEAGYADKAKIAEQERDKELQALDDSQPLNKLIEKYRNYQQEIAKITVDSQKEIDQLRASGNISEAKEAELERDKQISKLILDNEFKQYEAIADMGRRELKAFIEKIKAKIDLMKAEGKNVEILEEAYGKAQKALSGSSPKNFQAIATIFSNISGAAGIINEDLGRMVDLAGMVANNLGSALEDMKKGGTDALAGFSSIVSIIFTIADELDKAFGMQHRIAKLEQEREQYNLRIKNVIEGTTEALDSQLKVLERLNTSAKVSAYNETLDLIKSQVAQLRDTLDTFNFTIQGTGDVINPSVNIEQLVMLTRASSEAEAIRRGLESGFISQDQADIALEYLQTLEGLNDQAYELSQQQIEFLTQTNSIDLANQLADTIVNAFNEGEDAATAWGKVTDQVLSNAVKHALQMKLLSEPINAAVEQLASDMQDGALSQSEQEAFRNKINQASENFNATLNMYPDLFGPDAAINQDIQQNAFSSMTQQTGSELLGQFTALRMSSARVSDILEGERASRAAMRQTLEIIAENTSYCRKLEDIDRTLKVIETDGIKIR